MGKHLVENHDEEENDIENQLARQFKEGSHKSPSVEQDPNNFSTAFVDVPVDESPSKGKYYPLSTQILVKSLETLDIKNYSKMDANNPRSVEKHIDQAMEKNIRIIFPHGKGSYKDLTQSDRIHFLFLLREATMRNWKSKKELFQIVKHPTQKDVEKKVTIDYNVFEYYSVPKGLEKHYSEELRCYHIYDNSEEPVIDIKLYVPTIGTIGWIKNKIREFETKIHQGEDIFYDEEFYKHLQFLVSDWRLLNDDYVAKISEWYNNLSVEENEILIDAIDKLTFGIKSTMKVKFDDGEVVETPLRFREYKNIFSISNRSTSLLSDSE